MTELSLTLIIFLFPLAYSPGPGNLFFAANGAKFGIAATLPSNIGYHIATWLVTALIGLGFGKGIQQYPMVFQYIGIGGSLYVLYLAWLFIQADAVEGKAESKKINFWDGVILLLLNPKAYVIIVAMFTQFLNADSNVYTVLWISTLFTLNNLIAFLVWTYIGDRLIYQFNNKNHSRKINIGFGIILGAIALWMLARAL